MSSRSEFWSVNPATGEKIQKYFRPSDSDIEAALILNQNAFLNWSQSSFSRRKKLLTDLAGQLRREHEELASLATTEMGKPIQQSRAEVEKCAWVCEYYAENLEVFLKPEAAHSNAEIHYRPLGILLAIMPWNFPYWQVFRCLAPNLALGNTVILKHASNVPACAAAIESLFRSVDPSLSIFSNLNLDSQQALKLISDPRIQAVTLTGSTKAGRQVAEAAGRQLKKTVLELGGSDPYIVLKDANVELAAQLCAKSRLINTGQSCISAKRFIVEKPIFKKFEEAFKTELFSYKQGDPCQEDVQLGPLAAERFAQDLDAQVRQSYELGAKKFVNSETKQEGAYFPSVLLSGVRKGMKVYEEECFGPVAALIEAESEEECFRIANDTSFGLGAALFTSDVERGKKLAAERIDAGCCSINEIVQSDPRLPFGGIKESGYGRELGLIGMREFANIKSLVWKNEGDAK